MAPDPVTPSRGRRPRILVVATGLAVIVGAGGLGALAVTNARPAAIADSGSSPASSPSPEASATVAPSGSSVVEPSPSSPAPTISPAPTASPASTPAPSPSPLAEDRRVALQARLDELRARYGIPGASVAIIFPNGTLWTGASGLADVAAGTPVTDETAFGLASMSKTYTAALILDLAARGLVDLNASAAAYLPARLLPADRLDPRVTVRQLLDHTSGVRDFYFHASVDAALQSKPAVRWSARQAMRYVGRPYFKPGRGWHYSNTNYVLLGIIAANASGETLAGGIRSRFLEPIGLDSTWYQADEPPRRTLAHAYRLSGPVASPVLTDLSDGTEVAPFTSVVTASGGAGSMAGTATDVARWGRALFSGRALGLETTAEMVNGAAATAPYRPRVAYGLGVQEVVIDGRPTIGHSGTFLGMRGVVRFLPGEGITIAVLTNQSRTDPAVIARALLAIATLPGPPCGLCRTID